MGKGEKERRERRKEKRKRKKEEKKEKREEKEKEKEKKGGGSKQKSKSKKNKKEKPTKQTNKHGGVSSASVYFKSLGFLWKLSVSLAGLLGEGPVVLIFRCWPLGELLCPLPGAGLSGGCLPREAPGGTTSVVWPALDPWIQLP